MFICYPIMGEKFLVYFGIFLFSSYHELIFSDLVENSCSAIRVSLSVFWSGNALCHIKGIVRLFLLVFFFFGWKKSLGSGRQALVYP